MAFMTYRFVEEPFAADLRRTHADLPGLNPDDELFPVNDWGIRVKTTGRAWIYVKRMLANWRIIEIIPELPEGHPWYPASSCERSWCYRTLPEALVHAARWDGGEATEPSGWVKAAGTERRHGTPKPGITQQ